MNITPPTKNKSSEVQLSGTVISTVSR